MQLSILKPHKEKSAEFLQSLGSQKLTYGEHGSTLEWPTQLFQQLPNSLVENGYLFQFRRSALGRGRKSFEQTQFELRRGACFDLQWVNYVGPPTLEVNAEFAILAKTFGVWSLNGCRVLHCGEIEHDDEIVFSLVLGTLESHAAIGEERLGVVWNRSTDAVDFLIGSFSKPANSIIYLAAPIMRHMQNRFAIDSAEKIRKATQRHEHSETTQLVGAQLSSMDC